MADQFRIIASVYRGLIEILSEGGMSTTEISKRIGLDIDRVTAPHEMLSLEQVNILWQLGYEACGPAIGIEVAQRIRLVDFQDVGVFLTATSDVEDLLKQLANYCALFSNVMEFKVLESERGLEFQVHYHAKVALLHERLDFLTAAGPVLVSQYLEKKLKLDTVELTRPKPEDTRAWDQAFGVKVRWGCALSRYIVSNDQAHRQVLTRNEQLKKELQLLLDKRLREGKTAHPLDEVRTVMLKQLAHQLPSTESVADELHISTRTLHRRLADAETSFSRMLAGILEEMAKHFISLGLPASEIAERLFYTDVRTFNRAFKRWTGLTPSQFQKQDS